MTSLRHTKPISCWWRLLYSLVGVLVVLLINILHIHHITILKVKEDFLVESDSIIIAVNVVKLGDNAVDTGQVVQRDDETATSLTADTIDHSAELDKDMRITVQYQFKNKETDRRKKEQPNIFKNIIKQKNHSIVGVYNDTKRNSETTTEENTSPETKSSIVHRQQKIKFSKGVIMDMWFDTCMNITTWHNKWYPLFPNIPQATSTVLQLGDEKLIMGSLLRRIYGYLVVQRSGFYDFQLESHEGGEVLLLDTNMSEEDFIEKATAAEMGEWKELLYYNLTLQDMKKQNIFQRGVLVLCRTDIKTVWLARGHVYHVEIVQGGRFYAQYSLKWRPQGDARYSKFVEISGENLFYTKNTTAKTTPSLLWLKNRPVENYKYSTSESNRLGYHRIPTLKAFDVIEESNLKCPTTNWYKRNITKLYLGRLFVDYHLVFPNHFFEYTGGWPLNHLLLNETKAVMVAEKTFEELNKLYDRYMIVFIYLLFIYLFMQKFRKATNYKVHQHHKFLSIRSC